MGICFYHIYFRPKISAAATDAGEWAIIIGAYKIEESGVEVTYTVTFTQKEYVLLKGDTHVHTLESDGCMTIQKTAETARKMGLDFLFITDHNNYAHLFAMPDIEGITVLPGVEWTHYKGHAGLLGVTEPFESAFCVNSKEEAFRKLEQGRKRGSIIVLNHPFCRHCGWKFGLNNQAYDVIELVNGGVEAEANHSCMSWWQEQLCRGRILPVIGGSDFHQLEGRRMMGVPTTCLYALSPAPDDILQAIRKGNGYIGTSEGPSIWAEAAGHILGEIAPVGSECKLCFEGLLRGDTVCFVTDYGREQIVYKDAVSHMEYRHTYLNEKFVRVEVLRGGVEILISNPLYFG